MFIPRLRTTSLLCDMQRNLQEEKKAHDPRNEPFVRSGKDKAGLLAYIYLIVILRHSDTALNSIVTE